MEIAANDDDGFYRAEYKAEFERAHLAFVEQIVPSIWILDAQFLRVDIWYIVFAAASVQLLESGQFTQDNLVDTVEISAARVSEDSGRPDAS